MARTGPALPPLKLSEEEEHELRRLARRRKTARALALRARIVLAAAEGDASRAVAELLGVTRSTSGSGVDTSWSEVSRGWWTSRGPGRHVGVSDADIERVVVMTLESQPEGATHWSTRSMAQACGLSQSTVHRIWRAFGLQPHPSESFKLSTGSFFIEKVRDIVGLYLGARLVPVTRQARRSDTPWAVCS